MEIRYISNEEQVCKTKMYIIEKTVYDKSRAVSPSLGLFTEGRSINIFLGCILTKHLIA